MKTSEYQMLIQKPPLLLYESVHLVSGFKQSIL